MGATHAPEIPKLPLDYVHDLSLFLSFFISHYQVIDYVSFFAQNTNNSIYQEIPEFYIQVELLNL